MKPSMHLTPDPARRSDPLRGIPCALRLASPGQLFAYAQPDRMSDRVPDKSMFGVRSKSAGRHTRRGQRRHHKGNGPIRHCLLPSGDSIPCRQSRLFCRCRASLWRTQQVTTPWFVSFWSPPGGCPRHLRSPGARPREGRLLGDTTAMVIAGDRVVGSGFARR